MNRSPVRMLLLVGLVCIGLVLLSTGSLTAQERIPAISDVDQLQADDVEVTILATATPGAAPVESSFGAEPQPMVDFSGTAQEGRPSDDAAPTEIRETTQQTLGEALPLPSLIKEVPGTTNPDTSKLTPDALDLSPMQPEEKVDPGSVDGIIIAPQPDGQVPGDETGSLGQPGPSAVVGWTTIKYENFEGVWPNGAWRAFDNDGTTNGEIYWDDTSYKPRTGSWSAWAARGGAQGRDPGAYTYANNMRSWTIYGPFDLTNSVDAEMLFYYWNQSESGYDYFSWMASANGTNFYGYKVSGDSGGWSYVNFDLTAVPTLGNLVGDSSVWIAFTFNTDGSVTDDGAFVDDVTIQKNVNTSCPNQYLAQYYNNRTLSGNPTYTRCEGWPINQQWGSGGPGNGIGNDNFSARWTGQANIAAGNYTFTAVADDGIRVWLDGAVIIDGWRDQPPTEYKTTRYVSGGTHSIKVEYYEAGGGATAQFRWDAAYSCPTISQWKGEYWNNQSLSGTPVLCRNDANVDFDWSYGSPHSSVPADHFSARWTRTLSFNSGRYRFHLKGDDGIRLWVDGNRIIDRWIDQGFTEYTAEVNLSAGNHALQVEYYENGGAAAVKLWWEPVGEPVQLIERDGFYIFKVDMWNSRVSVEMVMANDSTNVNQTPTPVESVASMATRYASRNPILVINGDYFALDRTHGPEGLTVRNGVRFDGYGATPDDADGMEWQRSSLSISRSKAIRMGKQTSCTGSCVNWVPNSDAFYTTIGGGPVFVESGQRIGGANSLTPCNNEAFTPNNRTYYCQQPYKWAGVGMSQDGRYLYVIASSTNKTMDQAAAALIAEGAWRAMKLDGGGSAQLWYKPRGTMVAGGRLVANALMVFVQP